MGILAYIMDQKKKHKEIAILKARIDFRGDEAELKKIVKEREALQNSREMKEKLQKEKNRLYKEQHPIMASIGENIAKKQAKSLKESRVKFEMEKEKKRRIYGV